MQKGGSVSTRNGQAKEKLHGLVRLKGLVSIAHYQVSWQCGHAIFPFLQGLEASALPRAGSAQAL